MTIVLQGSVIPPAPSHINGSAASSTRMATLASRNFPQAPEGMEALVQMPDL